MLIFLVLFVSDLGCFVWLGLICLIIFLVLVKIKDSHNLLVVWPEILLPDCFYP